MGKKKYPPKGGDNNKFGFSTWTGANPEVQVNKLRQLPWDRVIAALKRLIVIVETRKLDGYDCETTGQKNTECTWGLCYQDRVMWPEPRDHIFPYDFLNEGRVSPVDHPPGTCPMDQRPMLVDGKPSTEVRGCFYTCRFFQGPQPTRSAYFRLIRDKIQEVEEMLPGEEEGVVAKAKGSFEEWREVFDPLCVKRTGCTWEDLCGEDELLKSAYDNDETPLGFIDWYIEKYDLHDLTKEVGFGI